MKRKNISRSLAVVLCASMLLTGEPASALAARADPAQQTVEEGTKAPVKDTGDTQTGTEVSAPAGTESQSTEKQDTEAGNTETPETGQEAAGNGTETEVDGSTESAVKETEAAGTEAESTEKITSTETAAVDERLALDANKKTDREELKDLLPRKKKADGPEVIEVSSLLELADAVSQTEGTVAPAYAFTTGEATAVVDGEEVKMSAGCKGADKALEVPADVFAADNAIDAGAIARKDGMVDLTAIAENSDYQMTVSDGTAVLTDRFQNKRLIVMSDAGFDTCGAVSVIQGYENIYILNFNTEDATKAAFDTLSAVPGITVEADEVIATSTEGSNGTETAELASDMPSLRTTSRDIIVAVVDSGYDAANASMDKIVEGADMSGSGTIQDENGHGTKMSRIITENSSGCVKVMPVKVAGSDGRTSSLKLFLGIKYAMEHGADIINVSMTAYKAADSPLVTGAVNEASAAGKFVVAAAGNSSDDTADYTPANLDAAIVVSGMNSDGSFMEMSNHGSTVDFVTYGCVEVDGEKVSGTSVSAAIMSYQIAQMLVMDNGQTCQEIYDTLAKYADDLGEAGYDPYFGNGAVTPELINGIYDGLGCTTAELLTCDWKNMPDEELDGLMNETNTIDLARFMKDLPAEDVKEVLAKDTMMGKPVRLWSNITEDENTSTFVEYETCYAYLMQAEYEVCEKKDGSFKVSVPGASGNVSFTVEGYDRYNDKTGTQKLSGVTSPGFVNRVSTSKGNGDYYCYIGCHVVFATEKHTKVSVSDSNNGGSSGRTTGSLTACDKTRDYGVQVSYDDCKLSGSKKYSISFSASDYGTRTSVSGAVSCTTGKITTKECKGCDNNVSTTFEGPWGHADNGGVVTAWPTCTGAGVRTHNCSRCGVWLGNDSLPAYGHVGDSPWNTAYADNNGVGSGCKTDYQDCTRCGVRLNINVYFRQITYCSLQQPDGSYPQWAAFTDDFYSAGAYVPAWTIGNSEYTPTARDAYTTGGYAQANYVYVPRNKYTLSYNVNSPDGKVNVPQTVAFYGARWGTLATASRTGYKFLGWFTQASGGDQVTSENINYGNLTVYAHWEALPYTLTFDANGGTATPKSKTVYFDAAYGSLAAAVRPGYRFTGWYESKKDSAKEIFATDICKGEATLYAHWITLYTISLNPAGKDSVTGKTVTPPDISKVTKTIFKCKEKDGTYTDDQCKDRTKVVTVPSMDNFKFNGYYLGDTQMVDANGNIVADAAGTEDQTWEAKWTRNTFIVTLDNSGAVNGGTDAVYEKCNTKDFYNNTELGEKITSITMPDFGSNLFLGYFDKDGKQVIDENGRIICDRILDKDETWTAKWDTQINIAYVGNEKQDSDQYKINYIGTEDDFTDADVELESTYEFSDNKDDDGKNHFKRTVTKEVDEKYEPNGELKVQSKIVAWRVGAKKMANAKNEVSVSSSESTSEMQSKNLLELAKLNGAITSGMPTDDFQTADAKLDDMAKAGRLSVKNVLGIVSDALGFTGNKAEAASAEDLRRYINMYAVWDNGPTLEAKDLYISLDMARDESENGVTEEWLLSMANAYDDELKGVTDAKGTVKHGKDTVNGTEFKVLGYDRHDFTQFDADGAASVYYQVKDAAGNITRKFIMVEIVDTSIGYETADWRTDIRFVSKKYYNLTNDGMEGAVDTFSEDSKWIKDPEYAALLTRGLNNKRVDERTVSFMGGLYTKTVAGSGHWERPPIQTWVFTHEDVLKVQEFIEIHGPGKMLEDDALQKFLVQFAHCRKTGAEAEKAANPGNRD